MKRLCLALSLFTALAAHAALDPDSPWPKFRANLRQTGASAVTPGARGGRPWSFRTGKGIFSSPVVDGDGNVYVGSADRFFYALSPEGDLLWKVETGEIVDSAALLDDLGRVYFGSGDGKLRALDRRTGRVLWTFEAHPPETNGGYLNWFEGNVAIGPTGTLYAPNDNFFVYGLDRLTGKEIVKWRLNEQGWSSPAVSPETGALFLGNNYLPALDLLGLFWRNLFSLRPDGGVGWGTYVKASVAASPLLTGDGKLVVGAFDGFVRAYDEATGRLLWSFGTRDHLYASPALLPDGTILQPSTDGTLYALSPGDGSLRWRFDTREPLRSSPAVDGEGNVYFGSADGRLYVVRPDGTLRWALQLIPSDRRNLNASPALGRDAVLIAGESGEIFSVPYDYCLRSEGTADPRCVRTLEPELPAETARFQFLSQTGSVLSPPPAALDANQGLAFGLLVRSGNRTVLSLLDSTSLRVSLDPPVPVRAEVSGDRKFVTVVPERAFEAGADGRVRLTLEARFLVSPTRDGLRFTGGSPGGTLRQTFSFVLNPPAAPIPLLVPRRPGDEATHWEMYRLALPLPSILPSYNQIGFDSLHYRISVVEGDGGRAVGLVAGAKWNETEGRVTVDPASKVLFPVEITHRDGWITMESRGGFSVDMQNIRIPVERFRVSRGAGSPTLHASTACSPIPTYGVFLSRLGFCNPQTDRLLVHGSVTLHPYAYRPTNLLPKVGTASFRYRPAGLLRRAAVEVTLTGSRLRADRHGTTLLLVDAADARPLYLPLGSITERSLDQEGYLRRVAVTLPQRTPPSLIRAYLLVDGYPVAGTTLEPGVRIQ